jgi:DNA-binding NarL/FixJ family response regulator
LIGSQRDLQVCGSAGSMREALQQITKTPPDVLVAGLSLKDGLGLELIKTVKERFPQVRMLVVSAFEESRYAERVLRSGALRNAPCAVLTLRPGAGWGPTQEREEATPKEHPKIMV